MSTVQPPVLPARADRRRLPSLIILLLLGLGLTVCLPVGGTLLLWLSSRPPDGATAPSPALVAIIAIGLALGLALIVQSLGGLLGRRSRAFRIGPAWVWLLVFAALLVAGSRLQGESWMGSALLQGAGGLLPGVIVLALAGRLLWKVPAGASWRQVLAQAGGGMLVATAWSFLLEVVALVAVVLVAVGMVAALPGGEEAVTTLRDQLADPSLLRGGQAQGILLRNPWFVAVVLLVASVLVPVIEETGKGLSVLVMGAMRRPSLAQAILWGIAAGTAFSVMEGVLATSVLRMGAPETWASLAVTRAGTTLMHCAGAGLTAYGIWWGLARGKAPQCVLYVFLAMLLHGVWNTLALVVGMGSTLWRSTLVSWLGAAANASIVTLALGSVGIILLLARAARDEQRPAVESPPTPGPDANGPVP